jgi:predicted RNA polymerase sigma factor
VLYEMLLVFDASPLVRLNHAVAHAQLGSVATAAALAEVEALTGELSGYHLLHATRAELLRTLGRPHEAVEADRRALTLATNEAERRLLLTRLRRYPLTDGS